MRTTVRWLQAVAGIGVMLAWPAWPQAEAPSAKPGLDFIRIGPEGRRFVTARSGTEFRPWGFNYDHDASNRLLETYWEREWSAIADDFAEMKQLGANTVRVHLQVSRFMKSAREMNPESLARLARLLALAETNRLYLDITGLGCYDKPDVPEWYNALDERERWAAQARFWAAVARTCRDSPAVFCYDLMNEPVLTEDKAGRDWTPGAFGDRYFVQRLTLDLAGRRPAQVAAAWINQLTASLRRQDRRHLITVGAIPWAMTWPTAKPVIYSPEAGRNLDFVSLHSYPRKGEVKKALKALAVYDVGKPVVIEELFPLNCSVAELDQFIDGSKPLAVGWLGFYWGKTIPEYKRENHSPADTLAQEWLEYFVRKTPDILRAPDAADPKPGRPQLR